MLELQSINHGSQPAHANERDESTSLKTKISTIKNKN